MGARGSNLIRERCMKIESRKRSTPDHKGKRMFIGDVVALWGLWVSIPDFVGVVVGVRPRSVVVRLDLPSTQNLTVIFSDIAVRWEPEDRI
jgi:hypothetical protein